MNLSREQFDYYTRISALGEGNATARYASVSENCSVSWTECFKVYDDVENFDKDCEDPIAGRITGNIMDINNIQYDSEFVLVVDDEEFVSEPIVGMLRHLGFQAESVKNGYDADSDITQTIRKRIEISIREECNLGVSVGYAQFSDGLSSDGFLTEADNRLYEAKAKKKEEK